MSICKTFFYLLDCLAALQKVMRLMIQVFLVWSCAVPAHCQQCSHPAPIIMTTPQILSTFPKRLWEYHGSQWESLVEKVSVGRATLLQLSAYKNHLVILLKCRFRGAGVGPGILHFIRLPSDGQTKAGKIRGGRNDLGFRQQRFHWKEGTRTGPWRLNGRGADDTHEAQAAGGWTLER